MAIGGALRAAMKAGNWASAARESRRRARALAQLNASGGIRQRGIGPEQWLREQGFTKSQMGMLPSGPPMRRRPASYMNQFERNPIEAPYEGFRVWGGRIDDGFPRSFDAPPPWMGRGTPPPTRSTTMYDPYYGDEFPSGFPRSRYDEPFQMYEPLPFANPRFGPRNVQYGGQDLPYSSFFYGTGY